MEVREVNKRERGVKLTEKTKKGGEKGGKKGGKEAGIVRGRAKRREWVYVPSSSMVSADLSGMYMYPMNTWRPVMVISSGEKRWCKR